VALKTRVLPTIILSFLKIKTMKKIKIPLFMLAICIALAASFAFSLPGKNAKPFTVYYYEGTSTNFNVMKDVSNWEGVAPHGDCNPTTGTIPCAITFGEGNFAEYLDGLGSTNAILEVSDTRRNP
jgi:hypothetical protein